MKTRASILLVDDQPDLLESVSEILETAGYKVLTSRDGLEALLMLKTRSIDLILSDIIMPKLNGYQLYQRVRENPHWGKIPFVFLTGRTLDSDIQYGKELGADDYLTKPIRRHDLLATVQGKLRRAQQIAHTEGATQFSPQVITLAILDGPPIELDQLKIFPGEYRVTLNNKEVKFTVREFKLLLCLAQNVGQVIPSLELIQFVSGVNTDQTRAAELLRPIIYSVRLKLGKPVSLWIRTIRTVGYCLTLPDNDLAYEKK